MKPTAVTYKGQGHSHLLKLLVDGQKCPESLHEVVIDVLGASELLLILGYAGLHLEGDVLLILERGTSPGERVRARCPQLTSIQSSSLEP